MFKPTVFISTTSDYATENGAGKVDWACKLNSKLEKKYNSYLYSEHSENGNPKEIITKRINESEIFLGIYGENSGTKYSEDEYIIHWEYDCAKKEKKIISVIIFNPISEKVEACHKQFLNNISSFVNGQWVKTFTDEKSLIDNSEKILNEFCWNIGAMTIIYRNTLLYKIHEKLQYFVSTIISMAIISFIFYINKNFGLYSIIIGEILMIFWFFLLIGCLLIFTTVNKKIYKPT